MCSTKITQISQSIISSLAQLAIAADENADKNIIYQKSVNVFLCILDLLAVLETNDSKDKESVNTILFITLPLLRNRITQFSDDFISISRSNDNVTEKLYVESINKLSTLGWFDMKNEIIIIHSLLYK